MILHIPEVLTQEELRHIRSVLAETAWVDGKVTAGEQSSQVKNNLQVPHESKEWKELAGIVLAALGRNPIYNSAVMPATIVPPLFNRYDSGMYFDAHVDNAIRPVPQTGQRVRTDVSSTLFLSSPDDYEGGELLIYDHGGTQSIKLPAGDLIIYPTYNLHSVTPVTRGSRWASFFWTQSMIRDAAQRRVLFDLDMTIMRLRQRLPDNDSAVLELTNSYHNLMRMWCDL